MRLRRWAPSERRAGVEEVESWLATQLHEVKHQGPAGVLTDLGRLCAQVPLNESMRQQYAYLLKREERMQYPQYQQDGWPIGSGIVESGKKVVMQARLKGAGMRFRTCPRQSAARLAHSSLQ
jgi:hypothetical protein